LSYSLPKNIKTKTHKLILPAASHGYETWSVTLREEELMVFENKALSKILGPNREKVRIGTSGALL
jgi:hypothetical protein